MNVDGMEAFCARCDARIWVPYVGNATCACGVVHTAVRPGHND